MCWLLNDTGWWKIKTSAMVAIVGSGNTSNDATTTISKRTRVVFWVQASTENGDVQTNMLRILDRSTHLGVIVGLRKFLFFTSVDNVAGDKELQKC
jgi:hypothetical protein